MASTRPDCGFQVLISPAPGTLPAGPDDENTLGDLNANVLVLLQFLQDQDRFRFASPEDQKRLTEICNTHKDKIAALCDEKTCEQAKQILKADLREFNAILARAEINLGEWRLIGDTVADRCFRANDYFTLQVFKKYPLDQGVILLGNHEGLFLCWYEKMRADAKDHAEYSYSSIDPRSMASLENLKKLIEYGIVEKAEVIELVENHFKPRIRAVDYTYNAALLTFYMHVPGGLEIVKGLAKLYGVPYGANTSQELMAAADGINEAVAVILKHNQLHYYYNNSPSLPTFELYGEEDSTILDVVGTLHLAVPATYPLHRLMWYRPLTRSLEDLEIIDAIEVPSMLDSGEQLRFVHGHDGSSVDLIKRRNAVLGIESKDPLEVRAGDSLYSSMTNLDEGYGRPGGETGTYIVYNSWRAVPRKAHQYPTAITPNLPIPPFCLVKVEEPQEEQWQRLTYTDIGKPRSRGSSISLEEDESFFARLKRKFNQFTEQYPLLWKILKYVIIPAGIAAAIVFSGGFAAIPIVGSVAASVGGLAPLINMVLTTAFVSLIGNGLAALGQLFLRCISPTEPTRLDRDEASPPIPSTLRSGDEPGSSPPSSQCSSPRGRSSLNIHHLIGGQGSIGSIEGYNPYGAEEEEQEIGLRTRAVASQHNASHTASSNPVAFSPGFIV